MRTSLRPQGDEDSHFDAVLQAAAAGEEEFLALDGHRLQTQHLAQLLQQLAVPGAASAVTAMTLEDNLLTDESCALLAQELQNADLCPQLSSISLTGNAGITALGQEHLKAAFPDRPDLKLLVGETQLGCADDVGLEMFKQGAALPEEEQPHASPKEQWAALATRLHGGASISAMAQVMREICGAVAHEVVKAEAIDAVEAQAEGSRITPKKVKLRPGAYSKFAMQTPQLKLLEEVLSLQPPSVITAASRNGAQALGSHRLHACSLICILVCCACDPGHKSEDTPTLLAALSAHALLPRVAHLAFTLPTTSCLHASFLDVFTTHTLPYMPPDVWQPLLQPNLGCGDGVVPHLPPLPQLLLEHAEAAADTQSVGQRTGAMSIVIQISRELLMACDDAIPLRDALAQHTSWHTLTQEDGVLSKLLLEQQGTFAGGAPNTMSMHGMTDDDSLSSQIHVRALFGIREFSQRHQSLNLGVP